MSQVYIDLFCAFSNISPSVESLDLAVDCCRRGHFACTLPGNNLFQAITERANCRLTQCHQLIRENLWYASNTCANHLQKHTHTHKKLINYITFFPPGSVPVHQTSSVFCNQIVMAEIFIFQELQAHTLYL